MALQRAIARQENIEKGLLDISECKLEFDSPDRLQLSVTEILDKTLAVLTYLSLNVRDVIMMLNRKDPDADTGPDGEPVKLGVGSGAGVGDDKPQENQ